MQCNGLWLVFFFGGGGALNMMMLVQTNMGNCAASR